MCAYLCVLQRLTTLLSYFRWFEHILDTDLLRNQSFRIIHHYHYSSVTKRSEIQPNALLHGRNSESTGLELGDYSLIGLQNFFNGTFHWVGVHQLQNIRKIRGFSTESNLGSCTTVRIGILSMKPTWSGRRLDKVVSPLADQVHMESITFKCFAGLGFVAVRNLCFGSLLPCTTDRALSVKPTSSRIQR